jgi:hypothetical protein
MPTAVERVASTDWSLVGSVMIGPFEQSLSWLTYQMNLPLLRRKGCSLKVIHRFGPVSSQISSAMLKKTILPKVKITTPNGAVTLVNAKIVGIVPHFRGGHSEGSDTYERTEISLTFQKIDVAWTGGGTTAQDDWKA